MPWQPNQEGETDSDAATIKQKNKPGHLQKSSDDLEEHTSKPTHAYFNHEDGTPISRTKLGLLSQKAHEMWETLLNQQHTPRT